MISLNLKIKYLRNMNELNEATKAQIIKIQCLDVMKYVCKVIENGDISNETVEKVQLMFDVLHDRIKKSPEG